MLNYIVKLFICIVFQFAGFYISRLSSAYFDNSLCPWFIQIKHPKLSAFLISSQVKSIRSGKIINVSTQNKSKMSVVGIFAHFFIGISGLTLVSLAMYSFITMDNNCSIYLSSALLRLAAFIGFFMIIDTINNSKV